MVLWVLNGALGDLLHQSALTLHTAPPWYHVFPATSTRWRRMIDCRRFPRLDRTGVWWNPKPGVSNPWQERKLERQWLLLMLEITEHLIGSQSATVWAYPTEEVSKTGGFGYNERRRIRSNSLDLAGTGTDGFARLRSLQQNMINGKCVFFCQVRIYAADERMEFTVYINTVLLSGLRTPVLLTAPYWRWSRWKCMESDWCWGALETFIA